MRLAGKNDATQNNPALRKLVDELERYLTDLETQHGIVSLASQSAGVAPIAPHLAVTGSKGFFSVAATLATTYIHHVEVQYSSTTPFSSSTDVVTVDAGGDVTLLLYAPATTRYFRARARLTSSAWSPWVYSAVISSGPFSAV